MAGLRPTECDQMVAVFRELNRADGTTILLIEHVMRAVMALARHICVLHHGEVIARGTPEQVVHDPAVLECYRGEEAEVCCSRSATPTPTAAARWARRGRPCSTGPRSASRRSSSRRCFARSTC